MYLSFKERLTALSHVTKRLHEICFSPQCFPDVSCSPMIHKSPFCTLCQCEVTQQQPSHTNQENNNNQTNCNNRSYYAQPLQNIQCKHAPRIAGRADRHG